MKPFHMFHGGGLLDAAERGDFVDAEGRTSDQQPHDFNPAVVCEPRHHFCPATINRRHASRDIDLWQ